MKPDDVVEWNGLEWRVDAVDERGVELSRHEVGAFRSRRRVDPAEVTAVRRMEDERVCMGSNRRPACYLPLSQCKCREA